VFFEKIKTKGLAHLSYILGSQRSAVVVDPRRDVDIYLEVAGKWGCRITHIFETHRNEDLLSGAKQLAELSGADVHHGPNAAADIAYAKVIHEGEKISCGDLRLEVLETPGHTDDSISLAVFDRSFEHSPVGVFTGDALFVGDVGRTDFYPERAEEVAGLLFESLQKLCALGDQAMIWPAHGAGSVCGDNMADRELSSIGHERMNNPLLQIGNRAAFIEHKLLEHHDHPPYFKVMEKLNLVGAQAPPRVFAPDPLDPDDLEGTDSVILDVRGVTNYLGAHIPNSFALPEEMLSAFAGWIWAPDQHLILVVTEPEQASESARQLSRIGFDNVDGYLSVSLTEWAVAGQSFVASDVVDTVTVASRVSAASDGWLLLDVRSAAEAASGMIDGALNIYVGELTQRLSELSRARKITVMCASGARATIAASILENGGFKEVDVFLGSLGAWTAAGHEICKPNEKAGH